MLVTKPFLLLRSWSGRSSIMTSPCQESIKTKYLSSTFKNVTVQLTLIRKLQIDRDTTTWKIQGERRRFERKPFVATSRWPLACEQGEMRACTDTILNICVSNRDAKFSLVRCYNKINLYVSAELYIYQLLKHYALMHKNISIDQIGFGHLISKHEMFCFEKTAFKIFKFSLNILYFEKTV